MPGSPDDSDDLGGRRRRDRDPAGVSWDGSRWVDVRDDNRWRPKFEERARAFLVLVVVLGALLLTAAVASIDDGDGERDAEVASGSTTSAAPTSTESTTTTSEVDPASVGGEPPPPGCEQDARDGQPLHERRFSTVLVLNGSPSAGYAGDTTDRLEEMGYSSMTPGNADVRDETTVQFLPGYCAEAVRLVGDLGIEGATTGPIATDPGDVFLGRAVLLVTLGRGSL